MYIYYIDHLKTSKFIFDTKTKLVDTRVLLKPGSVFLLY